MVNSISEKTNGECVLSNNKGRLKVKEQKMTYQVNTNQKEAEIDIAALGMTISDQAMSLGIFINL